MATDEEVNILIQNMIAEIHDLAVKEICPNTGVAETAWELSTVRHLEDFGCKIIRHLSATFQRLDSFAQKLFHERNLDALEGQAALDDLNNQIVRLQKKLDAIEKEAHYCHGYDERVSPATILQIIEEPQP